MANIPIIDGVSAIKYLKATGVGSDVDPFVPEHTISLPVGAATAAGQTSALTQLEAIVAALGGTLTVDVASVAAPSAIFNGQTTVTTAGTAEALAASQALTSGVTVKALASNTGVVYVGGSSVDSTNGFELAAGDQVFVEIANLATVYIDASVSGEGVSFVAS